MSSVNVGSIAAKFGLDSGEFLEKLRGVSGATALFSDQMKREMKETSREGLESLHLLSEGLGLHVSRPLARLLTQEFPAFAQGMQALLGGAAFGAIAAVGVETFERISKAIENARKSQADLKKATSDLEQSFQGALGSYEQSDTKIRAHISAMSGDQNAEFKFKLQEINSQGIEEAQKRVDKLAEAQLKEAEASTKAASAYTRFLDAIGTVGHEMFSSNATLGAEKIDQKLGELQEKFDHLSRIDFLKGTNEAAKQLNSELTAAEAKLTEMQAKQTAMRGRDQIVVNGFVAPAAGAISQEEIDKQRQVIDFLKQRNELETAAATNSDLRTSEAKQEEAARRAADAMHDQVVAGEKLAALYKEMGSSLSKLEPETDPMKKLDAEIASFRSTAEADFRAIGLTAASSLAMRSALEGLDSYEKKLDDLKIKLEGDILAKQALDLLGKPIPGIGKETPTQGFQFTSAAAPTASMGVPKVFPTLGIGGTTAAQFDVFSQDILAQNKLVAAAFEDAVTPAQQYQLKLQELRLAFASLQAPLKDSKEAQLAFNAALDKLSAAETGAQLHLQELQKKLDEMLSHSTSAGDGIKAFFLQLQVEGAQNGRAAFELLNQGLKGFEDQLTKAVFTGKAHWKELFRSMGEEAFKFALNKDLAGMFQMLSGTSVGKSSGLAGLIPGLTGGTTAAGAAGHMAAETANTTAVTANTSALMTLATKMAVSGASGIPFLGGGAGGGGGDAIPFFAEGGDATPGSTFISGESGAEQVDLDRSGGAHITPLGISSAKSGDTIHYYDQRGAVVTDDLMRKGDAMRMMAHTKMQAVGEAVANMSEIQRRTPQAR
jgi:hypothetical protein